MKNSFWAAKLLIVCLGSLLSIGCPRDRPKNEMRPIGPDVKADLLIYFNSQVSSDEINVFRQTVLSTPHPEGRGHYLPEGVRTLLAIGPVEGHEGFAITFFPNATDGERQDLIKAIKASPVVYKVLENAVPDDIKTLE